MNLDIIQLFLGLRKSQIHVIIKLDFHAFDALFQSDEP